MHPFIDLDMTTEEKPNTWQRFAPSNSLPKERVTIAYDTHDERKVRYAYGYFQFNFSKNGEFCGFAKDGNEQPKRVKTEDILYWKPLEELPVETCKTCGFYDNNCPYIRDKFMPYPSKVCKDYTFSVLKAGRNALDTQDWYRGKSTAYSEVLSFFDALQESEVDFEKEIESLIHIYLGRLKFYTDWENTLKEFAHHCIELGRATK